MLKQILTLSLCALIAAAPLEAKSRKSSRKKAQTAQTAEKPKESAYDKLFKKKHDCTRPATSSISNFRRRSSDAKCCWDR